MKHDYPFDTEDMNDIINAFEKHLIKLAASFARIRIKNRAFGATIAQQLASILPRGVLEREMMAGELLFEYPMIECLDVAVFRVNAQICLLERVEVFGGEKFG